MRIALVVLALAAGGLSLVDAPFLEDPPVDEIPDAVLLEVPRGLPGEPVAPEGNELTPARLALGRRLFFDTLLSVDHSVSCASCHRPDQGFASGEAFPAGALGRRAARHSPSLFNRGFGERFMWDGRFTSLESQVVQPIANEREMALPLADAVARLAAHDDYPALFAEAYGRGPDLETLSFALANFVRRIFHGDTVVDSFRGGNFNALEADERGGMWVFDSKGGCWRCHGGALFSDEELHATGVGAIDGVPEEGLFAVTGSEADRGRFKTPSLRGLVHTAPYFHDGSAATLEEVVAHYRRGGNPSANLDPAMKPLDLSDREAELLVAFLRALSRPASD